jgi:tetratricopeptide (TPR) repeat protein
VAGLGASVVLILAVRTVQQVRVWRNSETLWTHALSVDPNCHIAHSNLAQVYWDDGRLEDFVRHSEAYLRMEPQADDVRLGLANGLMQLSRPSEAAEQLALVLARQPDNARAHNWLGALLVNAQRTDDGLRHLLRAVEIDPAYAEPRQYLENLARDYPAEPRFREALEHAQRAAAATRQDPPGVQASPLP